MKLKSKTKKQLQQEWDTIEAADVKSISIMKVIDAGFRKGWWNKASGYTGDGIHFHDTKPKKMILKSLITKQPVELSALIDVSTRAEWFLIRFNPNLKNQFKVFQCEDRNGLNPKYDKNFTKILNNKLQLELNSS